MTTHGGDSVTPAVPTREALEAELAQQRASFFEYARTMQGLRDSAGREIEDLRDQIREKDLVFELVYRLLPAVPCGHARDAVRHYIETALRATDVTSRDEPVLVAVERAVASAAVQALQAQVRRLERDLRAVREVSCTMRAMLAMVDSERRAEADAVARATEGNHA